MMNGFRADGRQNFLDQLGREVTRSDEVHIIFHRWSRAAPRICKLFCLIGSEINKAQFPISCTSRYRKGLEFLSLLQPVTAVDS